ncbi:MAG: hypothetical protein LLF94_05605 [Chlamydiales bacterium]|nr:hypothetical protein [Chlamydiales bacterium]
MCTAANMYDRAIGCVRTVQTVYISPAIKQLRDRISRIAQGVIHGIQVIDDFVDYQRLRLALRIKSALSSFVARFVLYSINELSGKDQKAQAESQLAAIRQTGSCAEEYLFKASDSVTLSCVQLIHPKEINPQSHTIIYFPTNFEIWQASLPKLKHLQDNTAANVHALNWRKTGGSTSFPEVQQTLISDGVAYVRELMKQGIPPANIVLYGDDIGAAVAATVAAELVNDDIQVDLVSLRGYRSLTALIRHTMPACANVIARIAACMNWELNVEAVLPKLTGRIICMYHEHDPIVPLPISLKTAITEAQAKGSLNAHSVQFIKMNENAFTNEFPQFAEDTDITPHNRNLATIEQQWLYALIKKLWIQKV